MTITDFKAAIPDLASDGCNIITLFNTSSDAALSTIDAIAIITGSFTITELREAVELTFKTPSGSEYIHIPLQSSTIPRRLVNKNIVDSYMVYELYPPELRITIQTPNTGSDGYLQENSSYLLEPTLTFKRFSTSDYNVLVGSIDESVESLYRVKSDRTSTRTTGSLLNPLNIDDIINNVAEPANIQDSNYSNTAWTNGRYEGSKITTITNGGTDPIIQGAFFEGAYFGINTEDSYILSASAAGNLTYEQKFCSGKLEVPRYILEDLNLKAYSKNFTGDLDRLSLSSSNTPSNINLSLGDLLVFSGSSGRSSEIVKVTNPTGSEYFPYQYLKRTPQKEVAELVVIRGHSNTKAVTIPESSNCYRITPATIYNLVAAKSTPVKPGKLIVKDLNEVLFTNSDGQVYSGSVVIYPEDL